MGGGFIVASVGRSEGGRASRPRVGWFESSHSSRLSRAGQTGAGGGGQAAGADRGGRRGQTGAGGRPWSPVLSGGPRQPERAEPVLQIDSYERLYEEVSRCENTQVFSGWLQCDCRPFKQALLNTIKRWSFMFKRHLSNHVVSRWAPPPSPRCPDHASGQRGVWEGEGPAERAAPTSGGASRRGTWLPGRSAASPHSRCLGAGCEDPQEPGAWLGGLTGGEHPSDGAAAGGGQVLSAWG